MVEIHLHLTESNIYSSLPGQCEEWTFVFTTFFWILREEWGSTAVNLGMLQCFVWLVVWNSRGLNSYQLVRPYSPELERLAPHVAMAVTSWLQLVYFGDAFGTWSMMMVWTLPWSLVLLDGATFSPER